MTTTLSKRRRQLLRRLRDLVPIMKGSLVELHPTCGTPSCRCHRAGPKHSGHYFSYRAAGKSHTIYVPKSCLQAVRQAHAHWVELKRILEELTELEVKVLRENTASGRRPRKE